MYVSKQPSLAYDQILHLEVVVLHELLKRIDLEESEVINILITHYESLLEDIETTGDEKKEIRNKLSTLYYG